MPNFEPAHLPALATRVLLAISVGAFAGALPPRASAADIPEAVVETSHGRFVIRLLPELAAKHVAHFLGLVKKQGFDGTTFHRIIAGGIIQGGDPLTKDPDQAARYGTGGLGLLKAEFSDKPFTRGVVAAVRRPSSIDSAGDQFFVVLTDQPSLLGQYTIFGEVIEGMEIADRIGMTPVEGDRAAERVEMTVTLRDAAAGAAQTPDAGLLR